MIKTNVMRLLKQAKIIHQIGEYSLQTDKHFGQQAKEQLALQSDAIFKTLVTRGDKNGINVFCISVNNQLDLKKAAKASGNKKIEMLPAKEVLATTGYIVGACSPIGMKKLYPTYIDETATLFDSIGISAGARGEEIILNPSDLCEYINGTFADLI